jgi:hypothetical protein
VVVVLLVGRERRVVAAGAAAGGASGGDAGGGVVVGVGEGVGGREDVLVVEAVVA